MHLRKSFIAAATTVAAGLLALSGTALAATPSLVTIGGNSTNGTDTISGIFKGGTASFAGSTYGCTTGSVNGSIARGAYNPASTPPNAISFTSASVSCSAALGTVAVSLNSCTVPVNFTSGATAGVDTAVAGDASFGIGTCVKVSALFGLCTANVHGSVTATFNETDKTVGGVVYQELIFNGPGTLANASSGCSGLYSGTFTLNSFTFNARAAGGHINLQ